MRIIRRILWILSIIPWIVYFILISYTVMLPDIIIKAFNNDHDGHRSDKAIDIAVDWGDHIFYKEKEKMQPIYTIKQIRLQKLKKLNKKWYNL